MVRCRWHPLAVEPYVFAFAPVVLEYCSVGEDERCTSRINRHYALIWHIQHHDRQAVHVLIHGWELAEFFVDAKT